MERTPAEMTKKVFDYVIAKLKSGDLQPMVCAKSVCVDAHFVTPEEVGKEHIVWSHGKVEKTITLSEGMVLLKTLDENGIQFQKKKQKIYFIALKHISTK